MGYKYLFNFSKFNEYASEDDISSDPVPIDPKLDDSNKKVDTQALKEIQSNLKEFMQNKSKMDQIFAKAEDDLKLDADIKSQIYKGEIDVSKRNPYLRNYESLCRLERSVKKIERSISQDADRKNELNKYIFKIKSSLTDLVDKEDILRINNQIDKNNKSIKLLDSNIKLNKQKLSLANANFSKRKSEFETRMKIDQQRIKNMIV